MKFGLTDSSSYEALLEGMGLKRSGSWSTMEKRVREEDGCCQWCHTEDELQVHHIAPFHIHPELELERSNLITLCMKPGSECHFRHGHNGTSWLDFNPKIRRECLEPRLAIQPQFTLPSFSVSFKSVPSIQPILGKVRLFVLLEDYVWTINGKQRTTKKGFQTDLGTIPPIGEQFIENDDVQCIPGFVGHDDLCDNMGDLTFDDGTTQHFSSLEAAAILKALCMAGGASQEKADIIFTMVALFGPHWK